jgi:hypothetical protein
MLRVLLLGSLLTGLPFALGCDQLEEFRTNPNAVYRGEVIGSDSDDGQQSFIRQGFESHTRMDLTFDPQKASAYADPGESLPPAGSIDTYVCETEARPCPAAERAPGQFRDAALEPIPNLTHDALSQYEFPGGGRLRNYILVSRFWQAADATSPQGAAMVFVSLMDNDSVETRVIAPGTPASEGSNADSRLFGVFVLKRHPR